jgi:hypothetical protein
MVLSGLADAVLAQGYAVEGWQPDIDEGNLG